MAAMTDAQVRKADRVHLTQPTRTKLCGHYCVAMLTNMPVPEVCQLIGHSKGTKTSDLLHALRCLGYCGSASNRLKVCRRGSDELPANCLVKMVPVNGNPAGNWHWVCRVDGVWHDPALTQAGKTDPRLRMTSYLEVKHDSVLRVTR